MIEMIRCKLQAVTEGVIKRFTGWGRPGERFVNREYFQHYGFTSWPPPDAEMIVLKRGNIVCALGSDDRRYRLQLSAAGELAINTDEGDFAYFKRGRTIHVSSGGTVLIEAAHQVTVNTAAVEVNASGAVQVNAAESVTVETPVATITAPAISLDGNVAISGTLMVAGMFTGQGVTAGNGSLSVTDDIHAGGDITCVGNNPNHHNHP